MNQVQIPSRKCGGDAPAPANRDPDGGDTVQIQCAHVHMWAQVPVFSVNAALNTPEKGAPAGQRPK